MQVPTTPDDASKLDAADPLAHLRARFTLPADVVYLDGNSLGPLPTAVKARLAAAIDDEWGAELIRAWNSRGWYGLPRSIGAKLAPLIGARPHEVVAADGTSLNLFKVTAAALGLRPDRKVIVSQADNFPTDLYITEGLVDCLGRGHQLRLVKDDAILGALDETVAVLSLTQVDYRTGAMLDLASVTSAAHEQGILTVWDLSHSAGAFPVDLNGARADFAVGCGYKYLNGGPGAPAFLFVADRHQAAAQQPLSGWWGHRDPFAFEPRYRPADGIAHFLCGTPPILSMIALDEALDLFAEIDPAQLRAKSVALGEAFVGLVEKYCANDGFELASPRDPKRRGAHVAFRHAHGFPIMQALIARGVIGDFRAPDILRFGFAPLYNSFQDVWRAADVLREVMTSEAWRDPAFNVRQQVT